MARIASATDCPCETRTSTCRSLATASSGRCFLLAISVLLRFKPIPEGGPLQRGRITARWKGNLAELLPRPDKLARVRHQPALPWQQIPAFMAALRARKGTAALALRFAILTAARTGEVRGMTWREVDFEARVWVVPASRMKMGQMHRVPLSDAALAVLAEGHSGKTRPDMLMFPEIGSAH